MAGSIATVLRRRGDSVRRSSLNRRNSGMSKPARVMFLLLFLITVGYVSSDPIAAERGPSNHGSRMAAFLEVTDDLVFIVSFPEKFVEVSKLFRFFLFRQ